MGDSPTYGIRTKYMRTVHFAQLQDMLDTALQPLPSKEGGPERGSSISEGTVDCRTAWAEPVYPILSGSSRRYFCAWIKKEDFEAFGSAAGQKQLGRCFQGLDCSHLL